MVTKRLIADIYYDLLSVILFYRKSMSLGSVKKMCKLKNEDALYLQGHPHFLYKFYSSLFSISLTILSINASNLTAPSSSFFLLLTDTSLLAASFSPTTKM